jgi:curved DNA-binding protein CbpA
MIDCYRILDVAYSASLAELRFAYLAKMKALHPDLCPDEASPIEASDVTFAYWHLRDPERRAEHDRALFELRSRPGSRRQQPSSRRVVVAGKRPQQRVRWRDGARLKRLRAVAGIAAFAVAGVIGIISFTYLPTREAPKSSLAAAVTPGRGSGGEAREAREERRKIDAALASAAEDEFASIVRRSGGAGAYRYLRQCLAELATAPSQTILDYCIAFEDKAAVWEQSTLAKDRYFAPEQRLARYRSLAQIIRGGIMRHALMEEVEFLAGAEY